MKIEGIQALSVWGRETFWKKSGEPGIQNRRLRYVERLYDFDKDGEYMQDLKKDDLLFTTHSITISNKTHIVSL